MNKIKYLLVVLIVLIGIPSIVLAEPPAKPPGETKISLGNLYL